MKSGANDRQSSKRRLEPGKLVRLTGQALFRLGQLAIVVVGMAGLAACSTGSGSFLAPYGTVAVQERQLFYQIIGWMMIVIVPVFVFVPWFAWRYRRRANKASYAPDWDFSWPLEVLIWGVPVIVVIILSYLVWTWQRSLDPYAPVSSRTDPLEVQVVSLDWKWLFIYPDQKIATVGSLAMPVGRPVHFDLTSDTVMQSFFIPALGSQIYTMAGMRTQLNLIADRPGTTRGENTQFNGMGFQNQKFAVTAMADNDFDDWVKTIQSNGVPLDGNSWRVLEQKSDPHQVHDQLGTANMPDQVVYFNHVAPEFFQSVIDKFRSDVPYSSKQSPAAGKGKSS